MFDYNFLDDDDVDGIGEAQVPLWEPYTDLSRETMKMVNLDRLSKDKNMKPLLKMRRPTERTTVGSMSGRNSVSSSATSTFERQHSKGSVIEHRVSEHRVSEQHQTWSSSGQQSRRSRSRSKSSSSSSSSSSGSGSSSPGRRLTSSGGLSLRELNDRLERYIQQVSLTPESNVTHIFRETVR